MAALTADRDTDRREGDFYEYDVVASDIIYKGSIVLLDASGDAEPGSSAASLIAGGRAEETVDNSSGSAGDKTVRVRKGVFKWANSGTNTIDATDIGDPAYVEDDQTVGNLSTSQSSIGTIRAVDSDGVWVEVD